MGTKFYGRDFDALQAEFLKKRTEKQTALNKLANVKINEKQEIKSAEVDRSEYQTLLIKWEETPIQSKKTKRVESNEQISITTRGVIPRLTAMSQQQVQQQHERVCNSKPQGRMQLKTPREDATQNPIQFNCTTVVQSPFNHFDTPHVISQYLQPIESRPAESVPESGPTPADTSDLAIINITPPTLVIPPAKPKGQLTIAEYHLKRKVRTPRRSSDKSEKSIDITFGSTTEIDLSSNKANCDNVTQLINNIAEISLCSPTETIFIETILVSPSNRSRQNC